MLVTCTADARFWQGFDTTRGVLIASNGARRVTARAVHDHLYAVPDYPATSKDGIVHFVHFEKPLIKEDDDKDTVLKQMHRLMSRVCATYVNALHATY